MTLNKFNTSLKKRTGHSIKNSFYLQRTKEISGRYKAYYEYVITNTEILANQKTISNQDVPIKRTLSKIK